jgi:hypothetical protein
MCGIWGGQRGTGASVFSEYFGFPCHSFIPLIVPKSSSSIVQGCYIREIIGRSSSELGPTLVKTFALDIREISDAIQTLDYWTTDITPAERGLVTFQTLYYKLVNFRGRDYSVSAPLIPLK